MGSFVIIVPTGFLAIVLCFLLSVEIAEWFTWGILAVINVFFLYKSFYLYNRFIKGYDISSGGEVIAVASQPFVSSVTIIALIFLVFVDFSKLHLFWFYPIVSLLFDFTIGRRALKKLEPFIKEPNE